MGSHGCCYKVFVVFLVLAYCSIFPLLYIYGPRIEAFSGFEFRYGIGLYVIIFNVLFVLIFGYIIVGYIAYPYSNVFFSNTFRKQSNLRFGEEFIRCSFRLAKVIEDMAET